jgi:hypothetical protein
MNYIPGIFMEFHYGSGIGMDRKNTTALFHSRIFNFMTRV